MWAENLEHLYMRNGKNYNGKAYKEHCVFEIQRTWEDYSKINTV